MSEEYTNNESDRMLKMSTVVSELIEQLDSSVSVPQGTIEKFQSASPSTDIPALSTSPVSSNLLRSAGNAEGIVNALNLGNGSAGSNLLSTIVLGPVWRTILGLLESRGPEQVSAIERFDAPRATSTFRSAETSELGQSQDIRRNAFGLSSANSASSTPINISIQALDARSILDRSDDIAAALKHALLSNHEVNDSLNEI